MFQPPCNRPSSCSLVRERKVRPVFGVVVANAEAHFDLDRLKARIMVSSYEEETNPFQDDAVGFEVGSSLGTPSVERISFTPERSGSAVDSSQSTVNGGFNEDSRVLPPVPSSPPTRVPRQTTGFKNEIDRYIHSGDDVEINVRPVPNESSFDMPDSAT